MYFNYFVNNFGQNAKYKILLTKVIEIQNTFRRQSINEYSFNKKEKHKIFLGLALAP